MFAKILLGLLGVILLLPGVCSLFFIASFGGGIGGGGDNALLWGLWLVTFAIGWGGVTLLRKAFGN